jgi:tetratricopeptide (TPR) repeat protein
MAATSEPPTIAAVNNLPFRRNPYFVGRDQVLADIHKGFHSNKPTHRVQVIYGVAGVGKSHAALEYAYRHASEYNIIWWISSEQPETLATHYAELAAAIGRFVPPDAGVKSICNAVNHALNARSDWLLIFDNASGPADLDDYIPITRQGHVLITSRNPSWRGTAEPQPLRGLRRDDSLALLNKRTRKKDPDPHAEKLAAALDDLPLALDQAASLMEMTGMSYADYLTGYENEWGRMLGIRRAVRDYPDSIAMTWEMSYQRLRQESRGAAELLNLCAFLSPDEIQRQVLRNVAYTAPEPLASTLNNLLELDEAISALRQFALIESHEKAISIHRAVASMTRDRLQPHELEQWAQVALTAVSSMFNFDSHDLGTWQKCSQLLPHALAVTAHTESYGVAAETTATLLNDVGRYLHKRAQLNEARSVLERSLNMHRRLHGADHPRVAAVINNLGRVLADLGENDKAMKQFKHAMAIDQGTYGHDDPKVATIVNNFAKSLFQSGDAATARKQFEWALSVYEQHYGVNHPKVAAVINNLGYIIRATGNPQEAIKHFDRALDLIETRYGQQHPHVATVYYNMGLTHRDLKEYAAARERLEKALTIDESVFGASHPNVIRDLDQLGNVLQLSGAIDDAIQVLERALRLAKQSAGPNDSSLAPRLRNLSQLYKAAGNNILAHDYIARANTLDGSPLSPSPVSS